MTAMTTPREDQAVERSEWRMLGWYAIPATPLFFLYLFMGALPFRFGADLGWWHADYNTDAGEASFAFTASGFLVLVILAFAVPLITAQTQKGMRLRINGAAVLLLLVALPLVAWAIGLAAWFL